MLIPVLFHLHHHRPFTHLASPCLPPVLCSRVLSLSPLPQGGAGLVGAEVDLSGRHLERLPTVLFSSLHLTGINLSHNLLSPASSTTSSPRRRCVGHSRKQRDRRRRAGPPECREAPGARARPRPLPSDHGTYSQSDKTGGVLGEEEEALSGDSGVPSDRAYEGSPRGEPDSPPLQTSPSWRSFSDELQDKLRQRRIASEGCAEAEGGPGDTPAAQPQPQPSTSQAAVSSRHVGDVNTSTNVPGACDAPALTPPHTESRLPASPHQASSSSTSRWEGAGSSREEGSRGSYEDSSSSGVDESDSGSEAGAAEGGEVWASSRSLGALHQLRYFQQLQVRHVTPRPGHMFLKGAEITACRPGLNLTLMQRSKSSSPKMNRH